MPKKRIRFKETILAELRELNEQEQKIEAKKEVLCKILKKINEEGGKVRWQLNLIG